MAWTASLKAIREAVEAEELPPPPGGSGWFDARLQATYVPRLMDPPPAPAREVDPFWHPIPSDLRGRLAEEAGLSGPAEPGEPGLVSRTKSETARGPYGSKGITRNGRREVLRSGACLRDFPKCLGFWTITLPDEALLAVLDRGMWPTFQNRIRMELVRRLKRAGVPALVVGVAEIHPRRSRAAGRPLPHLHVVFLGKRNRWHRWALERWELDACISSALGTCGVTGVDLRAAGNLQGVRKDAAAYMAKYMTKGCEDTVIGGDLGTSPVRQWWFRSECLKAMVDSTTWQLPRRLICWIHRERERLERSDLIRWRSFTLADPRAPAVYGFRVCGLGALAALVAEWLEEEADAKLWAQRYPNSLWQPST